VSFNSGYVHTTAAHLRLATCISERSFSKYSGTIMLICSDSSIWLPSISRNNPLTSIYNVQSLTMKLNAPIRNTSYKSTTSIQHILTSLHFHCLHLLMHKMCSQQIQVCIYTS